MAIRVRSEVHNHSRLKHPSIVELYTSFEDVQNVYLVMELCENGEMSKLIKYKYPNGMPEIHAAKYMFKITEGLLYLHSKNIFHRDCSLANLLLTKDMQCVSIKLSFYFIFKNKNLNLRKKYIQCFFFYHSD